MYACCHGFSVVVLYKSMVGVHVLLIQVPYEHAYKTCLPDYCTTYNGVINIYYWSAGVFICVFREVIYAEVCCQVQRSLSLQRALL